MAGAAGIQSEATSMGACCRAGSPARAHAVASVNEQTNIMPLNLPAAIVPARWRGCFSSSDLHRQQAATRGVYNITKRKSAHLAILSSSSWRARMRSRGAGRNRSSTLVSVAAQIGHSRRRVGTHHGPTKDRIGTRGNQVGRVGLKEKRTWIFFFQNQSR